MSPACVLVLGAVFHLVYVFSVFDIYFRSPIDEGLRPVSTAHLQPPAKRLVLFVADGLRADTCYDYLGRDERYVADRHESHYQANAIRWPTAKESFLRRVIETTGSWGLSHTQVPTESRPGHVAMIAGFNEDVSAVTKGWQDNPVDFDHLFNQSSTTWMWGSPDITRMFSKKHSHVHDTYYSAEQEDFAAKDLTWLDTWVFNQVASFLESTKTNQTLNDQVHRPQAVFFLHLLGIDSNGHAHRPHSPEYTQNVALVDRGVAGIYHMLEDYFQDNNTAYIFTSDHGMANQGSHGDGDPANTRTPIIAWGAGVSPPVRVKDNSNTWKSRYDTGFTDEEERREVQGWGLSHLERHDMQQADIAPLMATLIGVPVPVNSVGMIPHSFVKQGKFRAESSLVNVQQLTSQVHKKEQARRERMLFFRPYAELRNATAYLDAIKQHIRQGDYQQAEELSLEVFERCRGALDYYQTYDLIFLKSVIVVGYAGWIAFLFSTIALSPPAGDATPPPNPPVVTALYSQGLLVLSIVASVLVVAKMWLESSPVQYYMYAGFPMFFWFWVFSDARNIEMLLRERKEDSVALVFYFVVLQLMVLGYTYRFMYAGALFLLALWPLMAHRQLNPTGASTVVVRSDSFAMPVKVPFRVVCGMWATACCGLGGFTFLSLDIHNSVPWMVVGSVSVVVCCVVCFWGPLRPKRRHRTLWFTQVFLIILTTGLAIHTDNNLAVKQGLAWWNQLLTCASFALSLVLPLLSERTTMERYYSVYAGLAPPYILLSINFEVLFYSILGMTVIGWILIEEMIIHNKSQTSKVSSSSTVDDIRVAVMFLLFVHIAFFGTGNIASMSSFQLSSTYRFVTVFSPFLMGALLIVKLMIPYTLVTSLVRTLTEGRFVSKVSQQTPANAFMIVLALCDVMAMHLFFWVRNQGSWKQIGNSISQFGFINAQLIFLPLLFLIAHMYMGAVRRPRAEDKAR